MVVPLFYSATFEFIGSFLLTHTYAFQLAERAPGGWFIMGSCLAFIILFTGRISGSHVNPAISLSFVIRRNDRLPFTHALVYWLAQLCGGFLAALLSSWYHRNALTMVPLLDDDKIVQGMVAELLGTFLLTAIVLVCTDEQTALSKQHWVTAILIGLGLTNAAFMAAGGSGGVLNPQISLGLELMALAQGGAYDPYFKHFYVFLIFPFVGAVLAVLFFEFLYKAAMKSNSKMDRSTMQPLSSTQIF